MSFYEDPSSTIIRLPYGAKRQVAAECCSTLLKHTRGAKRTTHRLFPRVAGCRRWQMSCVCMLEDQRITGSRLASWQIGNRTAQHHAAIGNGASQCMHAPSSNRWYYACKARRAWWRPLGFADALDIEQSRVIASAIAPDIRILSILLFYLPGFVPAMPASRLCLPATMLPAPSVACARQQHQNSSPLFYTLIPIAAPGTSQIVLITFPTRLDADHPIISSFSPLSNVLTNR